MIVYKLKSEKCRSIVNIIKEEADEMVDGISKKYYENRIVTKETVIYIYIIEKYMFRINSNLSVTFILEERNNGAYLQIISAGGAVGLMGTSYGAEDASIKNILEDLKAIGFEIIE